MIGITGSVGKTTCKEMVYDVLKTKYRVLKSKKSYNSEFGLLLTILHQESGFSSAVQWTCVLVKSFFRAFFIRDKYDYLVLEMGVDKPGDMDFLTSVAPPDISLITAIKPVHLDTGQFSSIDEIFEEKKKIFYRMKKTGTAIVNKDDKRINSLEADIPATNILTYGTGEDSDFRVLSKTQTEKGLEFTLEHEKKILPFKTQLYGEYHVSLLVPAIIAGLITEVPLGKIAGAIENFAPPPGRMSLIKGKKDILILDSSYNASPYAVIEALKILDFFGKQKNGRRIFVFGNMNELGRFSKELHIKTGKEIPSKADLLITVGNDVRYAASAANKAGLPSENIHCFETADEAVACYQKIIQKGDIVLAKGSQNKVYLEIFVKAFMADPGSAEEKLVRQDKKWKNVKP